MSTILLVEDSPDDIFFMKRALKLSGAATSFQTATDGQMAIDYISGAGQFANRAEFPAPSLVLLDLRLPILAGFEVLKWIRSREEHDCLPIIVLSSSKEYRDIQQAYSLGANAFLVKTPDTSQLTEMIKALTAFWLTYNEVPIACFEPASASA